MLALPPVGKVNFDHFTPSRKFLVRGNVPGMSNRPGVTPAQPQAWKRRRSAQWLTARSVSVPGEEPVWGKMGNSRNSGASEDAPNNRMLS